MKTLLVRTCVAGLCLLFFTGAAEAPRLSGSALIEALRQGGLVIVLRHTSSPREVADSATFNPDNVNHERQLDDKGRRDAIAIGAALRRLNIPIDAVLSSPAYRALETARLAGFADVTIQPELGNDDMIDSSVQYAAWLRAQTTNGPEAGNRLLITHGPNISAAFPDEGAGTGEGDALVFAPHNGADTGVVAKIKNADWAAF